MSESFVQENVSGWQNGRKDEENMISLTKLSQATGFPIEFIKEELVVDDEEVSLESLREKMMNYLNETMLG